MAKFRGPTGIYFTSLSRELWNDCSVKKAYNLLYEGLDGISKEQVMEVLLGKKKLIDAEDGIDFVDDDCNTQLPVGKVKNILKYEIRNATEIIESMEKPFLRDLFTPNGQIIKRAYDSKTTANGYFDRSMKSMENLSFLCNITEKDFSSELSMFLFHTAYEKTPLSQDSNLTVYIRELEEIKKDFENKFEEEKKPTKAQTEKFEKHMKQKYEQHDIEEKRRYAKLIYNKYDIEAKLAENFEGSLENYYECRPQKLQSDHKHGWLDPVGRFFPCGFEEHILSSAYICRFHAGKPLNWKTTLTDEVLLNDGWVKISSRRIIFSSVLSSTQIEKLDKWAKDSTVEIIDVNGYQVNVDDLDMKLFEISNQYQTNL